MQTGIFLIDKSQDNPIILSSKRVFLVPYGDGTFCIPFSTPKDDTDYRTFCIQYMKDTYGINIDLTMFKNFTCIKKKFIYFYVEMDNTTDGSHWKNVNSIKGQIIVNYHTKLLFRRFCNIYV
jgi:hypothetical protein